MRITRPFALLLVLALAVAGCAGQPVAQLGAAAPVPGATAMASIDTYVYGAPGAAVRAAPAPAPVGRGLFASVASPAPVAAPVGRGLLASAAPPAAAPPPIAPAPSPDDRGLFAGPIGPAAAPPVARVAAPRAAAPINAAAYAPEPRNKPYTLDSGDRLRVVVFGQDGLSNSYLVDASGHIAMPLIGSVSARGLTTDELSSRIGERLRQGFVREPHVAVEVEAYRPFFILGEVTQPGQYPYVADMTVETAVAIAGGFSPRALRDTVTLTRTVNGRQERMTVPTSYALRPGDTINVQERWF